MSRKIAIVKAQFDMKTYDQASEDLKYWLNKTLRSELLPTLFWPVKCWNPANEWTEVCLFAEN